MRYRSAPLAVLAAFALTAPGAAAAEAPLTAAAVAERSMQAMGGREAFDRARLLRFDFRVARDGEELSRFRHWWDRFTGAYRLEGLSSDGEPFRVLFDVDSRDGRAWRAGAELAGDEARELLDYAYRRFINDTYWLLMPWKWLDPGVRLELVGRQEVDGVAYDLVTLTFEAGVGLTSGDRYWAFVSPETDRMERWQYLLQTEDGEPGSGEPTVWAWEDWQPTQAGILLARNRRKLGAGPRVEIGFPVAELTADPTEEALREALAPPPPAPR
ncbi:MAG TPA: hypothetical protein VMT16_02280 [Thermoanaerobaculia bacterium]|nr:hypothetical protein [Thermoanaerobaculia bacterium]